MNKLSDIVPEGTIANPIVMKKTEVLDKPMIIHSVTFTEGEKGEYARLTFQFEGQDTFGVLINGGEDVVAKMHAVADKQAFPVLATLVSVGNANFLR